MKNGKNTDLNNQNIVLETPKKAEKGEEWTYPWQELTFMIKSIEI